MSSEADMRRDLEYMQQRADQVTDESLESTRRMLTLAEESQDVGVETITKLDQQGGSNELTGGEGGEDPGHFQDIDYFDQKQQLDRIEGGMDQINADIKEAEKNLTDLEKCCGLCTCPWSRKGNFENSEEYNKAWKTSADGKVQSKQPNKGGNGGGAGGKDKSYITRMNENDAREDEMDENLGAVSDIIGNLKNMAIDMGNEIESQNQQIDRLTKKASANETRIEAADKRAKQLIRK